MRYWILTLPLAILVAAAGCGGPMTQADMRKAALKRPQDPETAPAAEVLPAAAPLSAEITAATATSPGSAARATADAAPAGSVNPEGSTGKIPLSPAPAETGTAAPAAALPVGPAPSLPQTEAERRQRSIDNLQRIAAALEKYAAAQHCYPPPAIYGGSGQPLLSWRVQLLPQLGYPDLYARFHHNESWDSPHNRSLLAAIPAEYQSPERGDEKTNYLAPVGSSTAFSARQGLLVSSIEDGPANTVVLIEADDDAAVPWTQPADYAWNPRDPVHQLGALRGGMFFLVWGGGAVGQCQLEPARLHWRKMFCVDDGSPFTASLVHEPAVAQPALPPQPVMPAGTADREPAVGPPRPESLVRTPAGDGDPAELPAAAELRSSRVPADAGLPSPTRAAPPSESLRQVSMELLRQTYGTQYEEARSGDSQDLKEFAQQVLQDAERLPAGAAERYVALELCWRIALEANDVVTALDAAERTARDFDVSPLDVTTTVLDATIRLKLPTTENETVLRVATEQIDEALAADRYSLAERLYQAAIAAARRNGDRRLIATVSGRQQDIAQARASFAGASAALDRLSEDPSDAHACTLAGRYYCLVKERWEDGLELLAQGDDLQLAKLARSELSRPAEAQQQLALGDAWWNLSDAGSEFRTALRNRAAYWYEQALPGLSSGLGKLRAEIRIQQLQQ